MWLKRGKLRFQKFLLSISHRIENITEITVAKFISEFAKIYKNI